MHDAKAVNPRTTRGVAGRAFPLISGHRFAVDLLFLDARSAWVVEAVRNLEVSYAADRPRALIQMATGSGKTFTAITSIYRLVKAGEASG